MFAPRLRWPRDRDPDECNLQVRFATCSLAFICVFPIWQIPRNSIATPSLLGRSQTAQVRSRCVAQVAAHVRARASSQYACALHSTTCPRIASASARASGVANGSPRGAAAVRRRLCYSRNCACDENAPWHARSLDCHLYVESPCVDSVTFKPERESARRRSHTRRIYNASGGGPNKNDIQPRISPKVLAHAPHHNASGGGPSNIETQTRISAKTVAHAPQLQCERWRPQEN